MKWPISKSSCGKPSTVSRKARNNAFRLRGVRGCSSAPWGTGFDVAPERTWRLLGFWEEKPRTTKWGAHVRVGENDSRREDAAGAGARRSGVNDPLPPEETNEA